MGTENKQPIRPFSLEYEEAKGKIIKAVNEATQIHGVPFYLLTSVIGNISRQVDEGARKELENARNEYARKLSEYEQQKGEKE